MYNHPNYTKLNIPRESKITLNTQICQLLPNSMDNFRKTWNLNAVKLSTNILSKIKAGHQLHLNLFLGVT